MDHGDHDMHGDHDGHDHSSHDQFCDGDGRVMLPGFTVRLSDQIRNAECMATISNGVDSTLSPLVPFECYVTGVTTPAAYLFGLHSRSRVRPIRLRRDKYDVVASSL